MADDAFEITKRLREASEQNLKQAHAVHEQIMDFMAQAMDTWLRAMPANPMTACLQEVQGHVMEFAKENAAAAFTLAAEISNAPTLQDVLTLQMQFAQARMQHFVLQTHRLFSVLEDVGAPMDSRASGPPLPSKTFLN